MFARTSQPTNGYLSSPCLGFSAYTNALQQHRCCLPHRSSFQKPLRSSLHVTAALRHHHSASVQHAGAAAAAAESQPRQRPRCSSTGAQQQGKGWGQHIANKQHPQQKAAFRARASTMEASLDEDYSADNFYEILGVSPLASDKDIKRAYYNLMKDFHPDLSGDDESTEFCMLLNDIYQTLIDPERRAMYDALAGFSADSINPFADTSLPADQVFVDEFTCIGCRNCCHVCPSSFAIEDDWGRARVMKQGVDSEEKLQEAIDTCPVSCIHWVTASQLSLLEAAMSRMERVAVWSLMSGGGGGRDVFTEASIAWEKRQAEVRAKLQEEQAASAWSSWWSTVGASAGANMYAQAASASKKAADAARRSATSSGSYDGSYDGGYECGDEGSCSAEDGWGSTSSTKEGARIAKLAAKAARASRQWKSWQELQQRSRQVANGLLLTASVSSSSMD